MIIHCLFVPQELPLASAPNFSDLLRPLPHTDGHYMSARCEFVVSDIDRPIGITVLANGDIVVGASGENAVKVYSPEGRN